MTTEFELIDRYFSRPGGNVKLGVGDDAALIETTSGKDLVVTTDTLVCGTHFLSDAKPGKLGYKALAVNLSDLAAMGACPRWGLLAITMPAADDQWLLDFSKGFYELAERHELALIGGDTTRGPLSITVTALGEVASGKALKRSQARVGDELWVSGQIGSAALALRHLRGELRLKGKALDTCMARLEAPTPRVELGCELIGLATSAIDLSDGLVADARHLSSCSNVGIEISYMNVPSISEMVHLKGDLVVRDAVLSGGDDYELLFTVPAGNSLQLDAISARLGLALTRIGQIVSGEGVRVLDHSGGVITLASGGYEHFV